MGQRLNMLMFLNFMQNRSGQNSVRKRSSELKMGVKMIQMRCKGTSIKYVRIEGESGSWFEPFSIQNCLRDGGEVVKKATDAVWHILLQIAIFLASG